MAKSVAEWTEDDVLGLPPGEDDSFERKGCKLLDLTLLGVSENDVRDELAKQLSAFANTGGGRIIYGLTDAGTVENGGIARHVKKGRSTKEWLEDVIPLLTEDEVVGFNVYEIPPKTITSAIAPDKSLYVVDVPDSERAPHQSARDQKYYVRLGGKSRPARHRLIEDIRNRQRHPILDVNEVKFEIVGIPTRNLPKIAGQLVVTVHIQVKNSGRLMARNACVYCEMSTLTGFNNYDNHTVRRRSPGTSSCYWEILDPVYPGMEMAFWIQTILRDVEFIPPSATKRDPWIFEQTKGTEDLRFFWRLFADNAEMKEASKSFAELGFHAAAMEAIKNHPHAADFARHYGLRWYR